MFNYLFGTCLSSLIKLKSILYIFLKKILKMQSIFMIFILSDRTCKTMAISLQSLHAVVRDFSYLSSGSYLVPTSFLPNCSSLSITKWLITLNQDISIHFPGTRGVLSLDVWSPLSLRTKRTPTSVMTEWESLKPWLHDKGNGMETEQDKKLRQFTKSISLILMPTVQNDSCITKLSSNFMVVHTWHLPCIQQFIFLLAQPYNYFIEKGYCGIKLNKKENWHD